MVVNKISSNLRQLLQKDDKTITRPQSSGGKVFCIGRNKTGTTSLKQALTDLGYRVGEQREAEKLIESYRKREFIDIVEYCRSADAFQDIPFSLPYTYIILDYAFPGSKFILTERDSEDEWYESYIRHQKKIHKTGNRLPTIEELKNHKYVYQGWSYDVKKLTLDRSDKNIYDERILKDSYLKHNDDIKNYFRDRRNDLLTINLSNDDSYRELCDFLGKKSAQKNMPWLNRTKK